MTAKPESGEKNVYRLPRGEKLRRAMRDVFRDQRSKILAYLRTGRKDGHVGPLPAAWPDWHDFGLGALDVAERMTPLLRLTWDAAGSKFTSQVGLDPDRWDVTNPHTARMIEEAALAFADSTNRTTSLSLDRALARTREELHQGVVVEGESVSKLTKRIQAIFTGAEKYRARAIAQTETSRAVHAAQEQAAIQSGVVTGFEWLLSGDACPICIAIAARCPAVRLGHAFAVIGDNPHYSQIKFPPAHPHCNCTVVEVLDIDEQPAWHDTLHQPEAATEDEHRRVAEATQARDNETLGGKPQKPKPPPAKPPAASRPPRADRPKPAPKPKPAKPVKPAKPAWQWGEPVDPDLPIGERIKRSPAWDRTKELAKANEAYDLARTSARAFEESLKDLFDQTTALINAGGIPDAERAVRAAKLKELQGNLKAARKRRDDARPIAAAETRKLLEVPAKERFDWSCDFGGLKSPAAKKAAAEADRFLPEIVAKTQGQGKTSAGIRWQETTRSRPYADAGGTIHLRYCETADQAVHEWGHHVEFSVPGAREAAQEFLRHRAGPDPLRKLSDLIPGRIYDPHEVAFEDEFKKAFGEHGPYCGKQYPDGDTELISMGLEKLYTDPGGFARKDPEYCAFVLGILDGSLRKP